MSEKSERTGGDAGAPELRRSLGLRDLVPMQILLVVGVSWSGIAARQGPTHVVFWLLGAALLFLPVAGVIQYCVRIWPLEGGVYQWTKHAIGPFAGFISAWNFGTWALLAVSNLGIQTAVGLSYAFGPDAAWMAESRGLIMGLNVVFFGLILLINIPGLQMSRWVAHFGTTVTLLVVLLLVALLFFHPHGARATPASSFSLAAPVLTLTSLNLLSKIAFVGFSGLEQVAIFAGETRNPARTILRSSQIAAPCIAVLYILLTGSMLAYTPAEAIDLTGPVPQALAAAFGGGSAGSHALDWGLLLGRFTILATTVAQFSQAVVVVAETSRLPMVAAWDHLIPRWFTHLHPRFRTPVNSLVVIVVLAVLFSFFASSGAGTQEAFQLLLTSGNICYAVYYVLMFAVPLVAAARFKRPDLRPGPFLVIACVCGLTMVVVATVFNFIPIVPVPSPGLFALKILLVALAMNLLGAGIYWRGTWRQLSRT